MDKRSKKRLMILIGIVAALLIVVGTVLVLRALHPSKADPYKQGTQTTVRDEASQNTTDDTNTKDTTTDAANDAKKDEDDKETPALDPTTVATVTIEPMSLTVSYVKGVSGFEYYVLRTASGTSYVEFRNAELIGTKCTDDQGVFASIIENPSANETSTLTKTTTVDGTKYGLSLANETCTKDPTLLKQYQKSFSDAFGLLKKASE